MIATPAATTAGRAKSNMPKRSMPRSSATLTTKRLVDVPIVVAIPPTSVANPIGRRMREAEEEVRRQTLIRIGNSSTTMGVLFMNADNTAPTMSVARNDRNGALDHMRPSTRPTGSSAPVRTRPWPTTMSAQTATSASCPRPRKKSVAASPGYGNSEKPTVRIANSPTLDTSSGIRSRVKRYSASTVSNITAIA